MPPSPLDFLRACGGPALGVRRALSCQLFESFLLSVVFDGEHPNVFFVDFKVAS